MKASVKYPQNLYLKKEIKRAGYTSRHLAATIGVSYMVFSRTINGHYKGVRIVAEIRNILEL